MYVCIILFNTNFPLLWPFHERERVLLGLNCYCLMASLLRFEFGNVVARRMCSHVLSWGRALQLSKIWHVKFYQEYANYWYKVSRPLSIHLSCRDELINLILSYYPRRKDWKIFVRAVNLSRVSLLCTKIALQTELLALVNITGLDGWNE